MNTLLKILKKISEFIRQQYVIFYIYDIKVFSKKLNNGNINLVILIITTNDFTIRKKDLFNIENIKISTCNLNEKDYYITFKDLLKLEYKII